MIEQLEYYKNKYAPDAKYGSGVEFVKNNDTKFKKFAEIVGGYTDFQIEESYPILVAGGASNTGAGKQHARIHTRTVIRPDTASTVEPELFDIIAEFKTGGADVTVDTNDDESFDIFAADDDVADDVTAANNVTANDVTADDDDVTDNVTAANDVTCTNGDCSDIFDINQGLISCTYDDSEKSCCERNLLIQIEQDKLDRFSITDALT